MPTSFSFSTQGDMRRLSCCIALICAFLAAPTHADSVISIAYVGTGHDNAQRGTQLGMDEAQLQGEFLGQQYQLTSELPDALAIVAAVPADELRAIAARYPDKPVFNVAAPDDQLRTSCVANLLHIVPSHQMLVDAVAQWHQYHPDGSVAAHAWDASFEKYAALQLNNRFREQFGTPMDDEAWAGWAAIKLVSDMIVREQIDSSVQLLAAVRLKLAFDGQKGTDLSFRLDGQLRQPLLLVEQGEIVGEAPVRGVADIDDLDSLGATPCTSPLLPSGLRKD